VAADFVETSDGTRIAWDAVGEGPVVLLVHGIGYTRAKWEPQMGPLVQAGYRVVRFDLRGFGESTTAPGRYDMRHFMGDLLALLDALALEPFHLVGHSLGGMIAQEFVLSHPERVRSLTLVSTTSHNGRRATAFARLMVTFAEHGFDQVLGDATLRGETEGILKEAFPRGVELSMLRRGMEQPSPARANAWRACIGFSTKDRLPGLLHPVLVAHGTGDLLVPFAAGEAVARGIPTSRFLVEDGAGHSLPKERAESFNRALVGFLREAASGD